MEIIIRHPHTRLYLHADGSWQGNWKRAQRFQEIVAAVQFCSAAGLEIYQLIKKSDGVEIIALQRNLDHGSRVHLFKQAPPAE